LRALYLALAILRRALGLILLAIGILGILLPILPGWPFIIPAVVLLGRRDRVLRLAHLLVRGSLRRMRRARHPMLRQAGRWELVIVGRESGVQNVIPFVLR
jgi:uncharacterized membrane protein YbaN (DUF454 family)